MQARSVPLLLKLRVLLLGGGKRITFVRAVSCDPTPNAAFSNVCKSQYRNELLSNGLSFLCGGGKGKGMRGIRKQLDDWRFLGRSWQNQALPERHKHRIALLRNCTGTNMPETSGVQLFGELDIMDEAFIEEPALQTFFPEDLDFAHTTDRGFDSP